jgi:hypothetical protein
LPRLVDVEWRLDYVARSSKPEQANHPVYLVKLTTAAAGDPSCVGHPVHTCRPFPLRVCMQQAVIHARRRLSVLQVLTPPLSSGTSSSSARRRSCRTSLRSCRTPYAAFRRRSFVSRSMKTIVSLRTRRTHCNNSTRCSGKRCSARCPSRSRRTCLLLAHDSMQDELGQGAMRTYGKRRDGSHAQRRHLCLRETGTRWTTARAR